MPDLTEEPWATLVAFAVDRALPALVIIVAAWLLLRMSRVFVRGIVQALMDRESSEGTTRELSAIEQRKRMDTLDALLGKVLTFFIVVIAGLMALGSFGLDIGPAIAGLGVVGIAVGFGAQHLVRDYLNGALILIENQFSKGDVIRVAGVAGAVEAFTLRRTTLRDLDGNVHSVPNGEITVATNMTRVWGRVNEDVTVGYGTDIDQVERIIERVGTELEEDPEWGSKILEPPRLLRVEAMADSGITLKVLATVRAPERWAVSGELRRRLLEAFAREDVEIPFPHRVILSRSTDGSGPAEGEAAVAAGDEA
ncbi:MAG TPA: mechanosensitive ion channel family protein [Candidatus Deferrimicrobiaceae bacterium]|nr:mechanosensitive ion channel family protein [Candidatus Deferrimicrobiaceae bacterium]